MFTTIISTEELAQHFNQPGWVIVDCRFDLKEPDWGYTEYRNYHIPHAVYAHLDKDLASPVTPETGRHPLPDPDVMAERLGKWGIGSDTQVVVYDTTGGSYAVRLWFQLRMLGHSGVAVLDGSFQKWQKEGRPLRSGIETNAPKKFTPHPNYSLVVDAAQVDKIRQDPAYRLVDARAPERYHGETEPIDPVAGHIPGAVNRFHGSNLSPEGTFLPPETLRRQFRDLIGDTDPQNVVVYCGSGVTSCHHILAMEIAGLPGVKLYPGSWSEWIRDANRPVAKE
jgi:thiosulfate/3-mercaptopyruvate sulfurtransferase